MKVIIELHEIDESKIRVIEKYIRNITYISYRFKYICGEIDKIDRYRIRNIDFVKNIFIDRKITLNYYSDINYSQSNNYTFLTPYDIMYLMNGKDVSGGKDVLVGIVDSGINKNHELLKNKVIYEIQTEEGNINDGTGHGTHVAGIISGNYLKIDKRHSITGAFRGIAPESKLVNIKVINDKSQGSDSGVIEGIEKGLDYGVRLFNMSLGRKGNHECNGVYSSFIPKLIENGGIPIVSSGNEGNQYKPQRPACCNVISVSSLALIGNQSLISDFSNKGGFCCAYGGNGNPKQLILSLVNSDNKGLKGMMGTSMSCPVITGIVALLLEKNPNLTYQDVINILGYSGSNNGKYDEVYGYGVIDIKKALGYASNPNFSENIKNPFDNSNKDKKPKDKKPKDPSHHSRKHPILKFGIIGLIIEIIMNNLR